MNSIENEGKDSYGRPIDYNRLHTKGFRIEYVTGLDLGQKQDYSALALIERTRTEYVERDPFTYNPFRRTEHRLVHAERLPLGTPYPEVVERVARMASGAPGKEALALVVDATGVGGPVVDLLRRVRMTPRLVPVTITGGDSVVEDRGVYRVPKRDVVTGLQIAFDQRRLRLTEGAELVETLIGELMSMRAMVTAHGHERMEAWREGAHDDLVLAAGLAWWWFMRPAAATPGW